MGKKVTIVLGLLVAVVGVFIAVQPILTVNAIQKGLNQQDQAALEQHIDFPQVREGLKNQMSDVLETQLKAKAAENPFAMLGVSFVGKMAETLVDNLVTPKGLVDLLSAKSKVNKQTTPDAGNDKNTEDKSSKEQEQAEEDRQQTNLTKADYRLVDLSLIELTMPAQEGQQPIKAHLTRNGIQWRLTKIIPPTDKLMP